MTALKITAAYAKAPSFVALRKAGMSVGDMPKIGQRPATKVIVAMDEQGNMWQLDRIFGITGMVAGHVLERVRAKGEIDTRYWRLTKGEY
jgi:hypothetical protein